MRCSVVLYAQQCQSHGTIPETARNVDGLDERVIETRYINLSLRMGVKTATGREVTEISATRAAIISRSFREAVVLTVRCLL